MKGNKQYRFEENPKEKEFHDKFIAKFTHSYIVGLLSVKIIKGVKC
jgi:hypothetical protein